MTCHLMFSTSSTTDFMVSTMEWKHNPNNLSGLMGASRRSFLNALEDCWSQRFLWTIVYQAAILAWEMLTEAHRMRVALAALLTSKAPSGDIVEDRAASFVREKASTEMLLAATNAWKAHW